jgi:hypothetical protein
MLQARFLEATQAAHGIPLTWQPLSHIKALFMDVADKIARGNAAIT